MTRRLYLAGPDVFLPDGAAVLTAKAALVRAAGFEALTPFDADLEVDVETHPPALIAQAIFQANRGFVDACDGVLANLTPFRGPSADAGTIWEVGYAVGRGRPVWGYSTVAAAFADRTRAFLAAESDGLAVEDFGLASDNLMIHASLAGFYARQGRDRWRDLAAFEAALSALQAQIR